jgi:hypothetical protein
VLVYRIEHHETGSGPFQSEFYPDADADISPHHWGEYLPCFGEDYGEYHYHFAPEMRRWACPEASHIRMMDADEGETLAQYGWVVTVYEVPESCTFIGTSGKQCIIDFACAVLQATYDLIQFLLGKEVSYALPA